MAELFIWQKFCMIKCSGQETWDRGLGLGARNKKVWVGLWDANTTFSLNTSLHSPQIHNIVAAIIPSIMRISLMIPISASHLNTKQRPAAAALRLLLINSANTTLHNAKLTTVHHCTLNELCFKPKPQHISHQHRINNKLQIILYRCWMLP